MTNRNDIIKVVAKYKILEPDSKKIVKSLIQEMIMYHESISLKMFPVKLSEQAKVILIDISNKGKIDKHDLYIRDLFINILLKNKIIFEYKKGLKFYFRNIFENSESLSENDLTKKFKKIKKEYPLFNMDSYTSNLKVLGIEGMNNEFENFKKFSYEIVFAEENLNILLSNFIKNDELQFKNIYNYGDFALVDEGDYLDCYYKGITTNTKKSPMRTYFLKELINSENGVKSSDLIENINNHLSKSGNKTVTNLKDIKNKIIGVIFKEKLNIPKEVAINILKFDGEKYFLNKVAS